MRALPLHRALPFGVRCAFPFGVLALLWAAAAQATPLCSVVVEPKVAFDPTTFVFEGRVVGFAADSVAYANGYTAWDEVDAETILPPAGAVLVEPVDVVHAPHQADVYAVFPAGLSSDCGPVYHTTDSLAARYPVGEHVLVVAYAEGAPSALPVPALPLFAGCCGTLLSRVDERNPWGLNETTPLGDTLGYNERRYRFGEALATARAELDDARMEERPRLNARLQAIHARLTYEYERDLFRLHSRSELDRTGVLLNVRAYWFRDGEDCAYADLVRRHLRWASVRDRLGAYILALGLRPLPTYAACVGVEQIREEAEEARE